VLKDELAVSGGGGAVMQMPVHMEALESDITINYEGGSLMTWAGIYCIKRRLSGPALKR
jgi:ribulose 1,5-bisphosphate carboxylase large subunit-like protein